MFIGNVNYCDLFEGQFSNIYKKNFNVSTPCFNY